jgi:hypothetical protein
VRLSRHLPWLGPPAETFGVDPRAPHEGIDGTCGLTEGTLEITRVEGSRLEGRFSGRGGCAADFVAGPFLPFAIQEGRFEATASEDYASGLDIEFDF